MDILCIGKEAVYRRLRGEVTFTFEEAGIIAHHYSLSLDRITGTVSGGTNQFSLGIPLADNPMAAYTTLLKRYRDFFENVQNDPSAEVSSATNIIPFTFLLRVRISLPVPALPLDVPTPAATHPRTAVANYRPPATDRPAFTTGPVRPSGGAHHVYPRRKVVSNRSSMKSVIFGFAPDFKRRTGKDALRTAVTARRTGNARCRRDFLRKTTGYLPHTWISRRLTVCWSKPALKWLFPGIFDQFARLAGSEHLLYSGEWLQFLKRHSTLISQSGEIQRRQYFLRQRELAGRLQMEPA